jgi:cytochrome c-type biogenesis protein CcmH/NrfG
MRLAFTVLMLSLSCAAQVPPSAKLDKQKENPHVAKSQNTKQTEQPSALAIDGENKEVKAQTEKQDGETERKKWIYRVEIVHQPFLWVPFSAVCISLFSLILVWQQVKAIRQGQRAWIIISPKDWSPRIAYIPPHGGAVPMNVFRAS